jgi:phospholipase D1/2
MFSFLYGKQTDISSHRFKAVLGADAALDYARSGVAHQVGWAPGKGHAVVGDDALKDERKNFTLQGDEIPGFASSKVPTLEEKTVIEKRPKETAGDKPLLEALERAEVTSLGPMSPTSPRSPSPSGRAFAPAKTADGELYGAPADATPSDKEPPRPKAPEQAGAGENEDADEQENAAVRARTLLRKHLGVRLGTKNWTLPTPAPIIDPHGFDDPVCDEFFKDVWISTAVHNTEIYRQVFHAVPDDLSQFNSVLSFPVIV